jgi:hypothetical protein
MECITCPAGHYCGEGTATPTKAPKGFYQPNSGTSDSTDLYICPGGFHCPDEAMANYKGNPCSIGHYCPAGSEKPDQVKCPAGTYGDRIDLANVVDCKPCPAGYYCAEGTSTIIDAMLCKINHYCPTGTEIDGIACPAGSWTLTGVKGAKTIGDCTDCLPG